MIKISHALAYAKYASLKLYYCDFNDSKREHTDQLDIDKFKKEFQLTEENPSFDMLYDCISNSQNTISLYDLIQWFNDQNRSILEYTKFLHKLKFKINKWEKGKKELADFQLSNIYRGFDGVNLIFDDLNENPNSPIHRQLQLATIFGQKSASIVENGCIHYMQFNLNWDEADIKAYLDLALKYYDYLKAYTFFKKTRYVDNKFNHNYTNIYKYFKDDLISTAIFGESPFKQLEQFYVLYGVGGNERSYSFTYDLGVDKLNNPILFSNRFQEDIKCQEDPNVLAKTLRINRKGLMFDIKD